MLFRAAVAAACLLSAAAALAGDGGAATRPEDVKAAYVFHFARFVEWPPEAARRKAGPFVVAVIGEGPLADAVEQALDGKAVDQRALRVRRVRRPEEARSAHIAVVTRSAQPETDEVLGALRGAAVLTVGDERGFALRGGMVNFVVRDDKVRFEVNLREAQRERLRLSSQLLKLATIVRPEARP